jgi:hypothetical protein
MSFPVFSYTVIDQMQLRLRILKPTASPDPLGHRELDTLKSGRVFLIASRPSNALPASTTFASKRSKKAPRCVRTSLLSSTTTIAKLLRFENIRALHPWLESIPTLLKPFRAAELLSTVRKVLSASEGNQQQIALKD